MTAYITLQGEWQKASIKRFIGQLLQATILTHVDTYPQAVRVTYSYIAIGDTQRLIYKN